MKIGNISRLTHDMLSTKAVGWVVFLLLLVFHATYLLGKVHSLLLPNYTLQPLLLLLIFLLLAGYYLIHKNNDIKFAYRLEHHSIHQEISFTLNDLFLLLSAVLGTFSTHWLVSAFSLPPIILASGLALLFGSVTPYLKEERFKNIDFAFYAGVFVGCSSTGWAMIGHGALLMAGGFVGALFVLSKNVVIGVGGRLGTFAFIAVWLADYFMG